MWVNMQHFQFSSIVGKDEVKQNEPHIKDMLYNIIIILISNYYNTIYPSFSLPLSLPIIYGGGWKSRNSGIVENHVQNESHILRYL